MTTDATPAGPRLAELGPNAGLIDEMYRLYRENPNAVSAGWREFFADYQPRADVTAPIAPPLQGYKCSRNLWFYIPLLTVLW